MYFLSWMIYVYCFAFELNNIRSDGPSDYAMPIMIVSMAVHYFLFVRLIKYHLSIESLGEDLNADVSLQRPLDELSHYVPIVNTAWLMGAFRRIIGNCRSHPVETEAQFGVEVKKRGYLIPPVIIAIFNTLIVYLLAVDMAFLKEIMIWVIIIALVVTLFVWPHRKDDFYQLSVLSYLMIFVWLLYPLFLALKFLRHDNQRLLVPLALGFCAMANYVVRCAKKYIRKDLSAYF